MTRLTSSAFPVQDDFLQDLDLSCCRYRSPLGLGASFPRIGFVWTALP